MTADHIVTLPVVRQTKHTALNERGRVTPSRPLQATVQGNYFPQQILMTHALILFVLHY